MRSNSPHHPQRFDTHDSKFAGVGQPLEKGKRGDVIVLVRQAFWALQSSQTLKVHLTQSGTFSFHYNATWFGYGSMGAWAFGHASKDIGMLPGY